MRMLHTGLLAAAITTAPLFNASAAQEAVGAIQCGSCADWNQPQQPFNIAANTWYVGTSELSALLVTGPEGHILLDGALPQSAPIIEQNIKALGFRLEDVKLILNSHAHFDHAGGIAALQKKSGARVAASIHGAQVLRDGAIGSDDPQFDGVPGFNMTKIPGALGVPDGATLTVGPLKITAHYTPGHTPGSTSWTWVSCERGSCLNMVYADSLTPVSADGFQYSGARALQFRSTIDRVGALPCDVIVSTHPGFTDTLKKHAARTPANNTFITPHGCREYAAEAHARLDLRLADEKRGVAAGAAHPH